MIDTKQILYGLYTNNSGFMVSCKKRGRVSMNDLLKYLYEALMVVLVIITIVTLWTEHTFNSTVNTIVWFIFFVDFVVRFILAKSKWQYIRSNPFLIIAIIPFDQFFQIARIVRVVYLFRIK